MSTIAARAEALLGTAVVATTPVAGGSICTATRLRLSDGRSAFVKTLSRAPADFFASEARGLEWLRDAGGVELPEVLAVSDDCLILTWIDTGQPSADAAERLARQLAATHAAAAPCFGADQDAYIGTAPLFNRPADNWAEFWVSRRILPYVRVARDNGVLATADAVLVEQAMQHIDGLAGDPEPPSRLHGDLWSGNIVWGSDHLARLVDPACYGGHRESDLSVLCLFGAPYLDHLIGAYHEAAPLSDGWRDRLPLHQIHPLLVHAIHFGGSYGARAGAAARSLLQGATTGVRASSRNPA